MPAELLRTCLYRASLSCTCCFLQKSREHRWLRISKTKQKKKKKNGEDHWEFAKI
jgi:hypothetical protein